MASIIRRKYTRVVDGKKVTKFQRCWYVQFRDAAGRTQRIKGYTDKGATKQLAAKLEAQAARGEQNMLDPFRVTRRAPIAEHIADYVADLVASGRDGMYIANQKNRLARLARECKWSCLDDVETNSFTRWREKERRDDSTRKGRLGVGASATTLNQYLETARAFTNWCATHDRCPGIPTGGGKKIAAHLAGVSKVDGEKRRKRRAFEDAQLITMLKAAPDRALVYRFGIASGLRRAELEDLCWGDLRLMALTPYIQLRAEATKADRADRVPIPGTLVADLRAAKPVDAKDSDPVFEVVPTIDQWKIDLAAAGIPYKDDMGRQLDFHGGCRQTLCTRMHAAGIPQREAMRRLRVTDPKLLNSVYADDAQLAGIAAALPEVTAPATKAASDVG